VDRQERHRDHEYAQKLADLEKCPKVSNMISRELIWQGVGSEKALDL
jgi:hypothetical protein